MASSSSSSSKPILSLLISSAIFISIAVFFKIYVTPFISASKLPYHSVLGWLKPPYLYLIVNLIIVTIAVFSRFQLDHPNHPNHLVPPPTPAPADPERPVEVFDDKYVVAEDGGDGVGEIPVTESWPESVSSDENLQPPSAVFVHRRSVSGTSKGVMNSREEIWKAITDSKMTRHMSRRDTWQDHKHDVIVPPPTTFKEQNKRQLPPPAPMVRKELSMSQDELNRQVEAFIERINKEMRIQRQLSLEQLKIYGDDFIMAKQRGL